MFLHLRLKSQKIFLVNPDWKEKEFGSEIQKREKLKKKKKGTKSISPNSSTWESGLRTKVQEVSTKSLGRIQSKKCKLRKPCIYED